MNAAATPAITYLFVPAAEERKVAKALASDADAVILDLEDGVAEAQKRTARAMLRESLTHWSRSTRSEVWVRVNNTEAHFAEDVASIEWHAVAGAVLPMAESRTPLAELRAAGATRLLALIETAAGFRALDELATVDGVERFAIGTYDLTLDFGLLGVADPDELELMWQVRGQLALASRQLNLQPPLDAVYGRIDDDAGLRAVCTRARSFGFGGKLLVHPRQIAIAREAFRPSADELQFAREIVDAYDSAIGAGRGALRVRGRMIDRPMVLRARALLGRWDLPG